MNVQANGAKPLTVKKAMEIIRTTGCFVTRHDGEFRVNFKGGDEGTAYYTTDISDAVFTAMEMHHRRTMRLIQEMQAIRSRPLSSFVQCL